MNKKVAVLTSGGDAPGMNAAVRAIVRDARAAEYHMSSIVLGVVMSQPFQMRMSR